MSKRIRTFIAVEIPRPVRDKLVALQDELRAAADDVKWVEPDNLHLTLKFLGGVNETDLYAVCKTAERSVAERSPFEMQIAGVGAFPTASRPRVIWAGIRLGGSELTEIHDALERLYGPLGYPREDRSFTPHLTVGRSRQSNTMPQLAEALDNFASWEAGTIFVREILVMSSQLSSKGPTYAIMGRCRLHSPPS